MEAKCSFSSRDTNCTSSIFSKLAPASHPCSCSYAAMAAGSPKHKATLPMRAGPQAEGMAPASRPCSGLRSATSLPRLRCGRGTYGDDERNELPRGAAATATTCMASFRGARRLRRGRSWPRRTPGHGSGPSAGGSHKRHWCASAATRNRCFVPEKRCHFLLYLSSMTILPRHQNTYMTTY
uniref:Uncharacterized protein n=1 Tax=Setaria italica TaxID=4555 RepID=K3YJU8_SETIT